MKSRTLTCITGMTLFTALVIPWPGTLAPTAEVSPTTLTFPIQQIGTTSAAKIVTLKNTGTTS